MNSNENSAAALTALLVQRNLPENMYAAVHRYVLEHKPVGYFLMSLFRNDLAAFMCADSKNRACFEGWICLLYWDLPSACWGSKDKVNRWLEKK